MGIVVIGWTWIDRAEREIWLGGDRISIDIRTRSHHRRTLFHRGIIGEQETGVRIGRVSVAGRRTPTLVTGARGAADEKQHRPANQRHAHVMPDVSQVERHLMVLALLLLWLLLRLLFRR